MTGKIRLLPFTSLKLRNTLNRVILRWIGNRSLISIWRWEGFPKYLSYVGRGKSATQIINEVCFSPNGGLFNEFDNLYKSLFDNYEHHIAIVKALAKASDGLIKEELLDKVKLPSGGSSSRIIQDLVDAGFLIMCRPSIEKRPGESID